MSSERWQEVSKAKPCPACGKPDWCAWTPDGAMLKCERTVEPPPSMVKVKAADGGALFRFADANAPRTRKPTKASSRGGKRRVVYKKPEEAFAAAGRMVKGQLVEAWTYPADALRVARYALADGDKTYRPIHPVGNGWALGDPDGPLPLYRGDKIGEAGPVFVTEGEACADAAASVGLVAVTSAHGSGAARKTDWKPLAGREVFILPDNDEAGSTYAEEVGTILSKLRPPAMVKVVELPGLDEGEDIADWIGADGPMGCKSADEIKAAVLELAKTAKIWTPKASAQASGPVLICMADVEPREVRWLWPGRVPLGRITLLVGRPSEGKSFLTIDMAARVTTGRTWPDGSECPAGSVILISAEDDPNDTIRPRLDTHDADVRKVHLLSAVRRMDEDGQAFEVMFTLADVAALEAALKTCPDCRLIVVDPIGSFLGGRTDAHRDNEVRGVLAPVAKLAEKYGPAVLVVAHRRKSAGSIADDLALGSRAFTGIARAVWHLTRDSDNKARRLLPGKNNLVPEGVGLAFSIIGTPGVVAWERDPVDMSADDALAVENNRKEGSKPGPEPEALNQAAEWLGAELADGLEHPVKTLRAEGQAAGLSWRSVQRASAKLGVKVTRPGFGEPCVWRLPAPIHANPVENNEPGTNGTNADLQGKTGDSGSHECHTCQDDSLGTNGPDLPATLPLPRPAGPRLDPGRPGPMDLLDKEQRGRYDAVYHSCPAGMSPTEKHASAWRAALREGAP